MSSLLVDVSSPYNLSKCKINFVVGLKTLLSSKLIISSMMCFGKLTGVNVQI